MAQRKLQQEIDKTFKKVAEGIQTFEGIYDKIQQAGNASQKDKLEDALKREIKKLQRHRDQIKTWAAGNEIKDKKPLLEQRKAIEGEMEKFKAVEKEMKTKAFSKEGLNATAKLDPKEREKEEATNFLQAMVEELDHQTETLEAEEESLQATVKRGKKDTGKADRLSEITRTTERHKFHQGKLELLLRSLQNGNVETEQVQELEDGIKYYVEENQSVDFMEDETMYDDLNLDEDEGVFGLGAEADRVSSQDAQSTADDQQDTAEIRGPPVGGGKPKSTSISEPQTAAARRPSNAFKSPLPALATLHTPHGSVPSGTVTNPMKPAPPPSRPPGETLKYASAAAAAAAADKSASVGIAPLPPPPGTSNPQSTTVAPGLSTQTSASRSGPTTSPNIAPSLSASSSSSTPATKAVAPVTSSNETSQAQLSKSRSPPLQPVTMEAPVDTRNAPLPPPNNTQNSSRSPSIAKVPSPPTTSAATSAMLASTEALAPSDPVSSSSNSQPNGGLIRPEEPEPIFHLPPGLQDLIQSLETAKSRSLDPDSPSVQQAIQNSAQYRPSYLDAEKPRQYRPEIKYNTPDYFPQEPFVLVDDPSLYNRVETDTLFYIFYYRQNTFQQYMAAKSLKSQSWRFHKQYQTWFQRHEEPKTITEEFEQGTYRFFDYESTWMNRRKADFRFAYKFLEDDL